MFRVGYSSKRGKRGVEVSSLNDSYQGRLQGEVLRGTLPRVHHDFADYVARDLKRVSRHTDIRRRR
jgi:hypothetical protein